MPITIHHHLHSTETALPVVPLRVDRHTLARRRWRASALDGTDFAFDLDHPLDHDDVIHQTAAAVYRIEQLPEATLEIPLPAADPAAAARLGWLIGNLHFTLQTIPGHLVVPADSAIVQLLQRENIPHTPASRIFQPLSGGHSHGHGHDH